MNISYNGITSQAQAEKNWGIFRVVDGKKKPMSLDDGNVVGKDDAFCHTLTDVLHLVNEADQWLGYCPRPGSTYVALDFDHVLDETGEVVPWAKDILGDWYGKEGTTPSGEGVRVLIPRTDDMPEMQSERAGLGYYGGGGVAVTVPVEMLTDDDDNPSEDAEMLERVWKVMEQNKEAHAEGGATVEEQDRQWSKYFLSNMGENEVAAALSSMITCFGDVSDRHDWLGFMFACKSLQEYVTCDVFSMWDAHCQRFDGYNAEENEYQWHKAGGKKSGGTSWLWLRAKARRNGWDEAAWEPERNTQTSALASMAREQPDFEERAAAVEEDVNADTMEAVQERYVWNETDGTIYDLEGSDIATTKTLMGVKRAWQPFPLEFDDGPVNPIDWWLNQHDKMVTDQPPRLDPRQPRGFVGQTNGYINTYQPFEPMAGACNAVPDDFLRLVGHVFPTDTDYALDWMAWKLQRPWERGVALVSYTPTFGTGRGTLYGIMRSLIPNSINIGSERLFGDKSNQFNSHLSNVLVTVSEVDDATTENKSVSRAVYNRLKQLVDPNERHVTIERKGKDGVQQEVYTSFMIATNAGGALPLEAGDRRFSVLKGNDHPLIATLPDLVPFLQRVQREDVATLSAIWHFLMTRDVKAFNPFQPCETDAKAAMIEDSKSPVDLAMEELVAVFPAFTATLAAKIIGRWAELEHMRPDDIARQVAAWTRKHSDRPSWIKSKNGLVSVEGSHHRIRCVRSSVSAGEGTHKSHVVRMVAASTQPRKGDAMAMVVSAVETQE